MRSTQAVSGILLAAISSPAAWGAGLFDVNTTADAGPGSLRQAILDANTAGGGTINVSIGGLVSLAAPPADRLHPAYAQRQQPDRQRRKPCAPLFHRRAQRSTG
jgi:hypothetical protein